MNWYARIKITAFTGLAILGLAGCPAEPKLSVSSETVHVGLTEDATAYAASGTFSVLNVGEPNSSLRFRIETPSGKSWMNVEPRTGVCEPFFPTPITVTVNRATAAKATPPAFATTELIVTSLNDKDEEIDSRTVVVTTAPNYYTATYASVDCKELLEGRSFSFAPNGSISYYGLTPDSNAYRKPYQFSTDPAGGVPLNFVDPAIPVEISLGANRFTFYDVQYDKVYVGSGGVIGFSAAASGRADTLTRHFAVPRITALSPIDATQSGALVSWKSLSDRVVITFEDCPAVGSPSGSGPNTFQVELFHDGEIRTTYLLVNLGADDRPKVLVGLSFGPGQIPEDYLPSQLPAGT